MDIRSEVVVDHSIFKATYSNTYKQKHNNYKGTRALELHTTILELHLVISENSQMLPTKCGKHCKVTLLLKSLPGGLLPTIYASTHRLIELQATMGKRPGKYGTPALS